ncbi:MAG: hypothetical protein Q8Q14_04685 [Gemmatimonadales bacterium]|nr:hypothetical protein [Gemmatimonadales bacterium]
MSDWQALGKRAVAAGFEWRPGMLDLLGLRYGRRDAPDSKMWIAGPNLSDGASLGAYVAQLRERAGDETLVALPLYRRGRVVYCIRRLTMSGTIALVFSGEDRTFATRAEAWVAFAEWFKEQESCSDR